MNIMQKLCIGLLSLFFGYNITAFDSFILLSDQETSALHDHTLQCVSEHAITHDEASVLLNFFYHSYLFAQYDHLIRTLITKTQDICRAIQDELDPEKSNTLIVLLAKIQAYIPHLSEQRKNHYIIWKKVDVHIDKAYQLESTLTSLQTHTNQFLRRYLNNRMTDINRYLDESKQVLTTNSQTLVTLAHAIDTLIQEPELFSREYEDTALNKINSLFGLSQTLAQKAGQLLEIKQLCIDYAYDLQNISATFFYTCYKALYQDHLKRYPDRHMCFIFDTEGIIEQPSERLPLIIEITMIKNL